MKTVRGFFIPTTKQAVKIPHFKFPWKNTYMPDRHHERLTNQGKRRLEAVRLSALLGYDACSAFLAFLAARSAALASF